MQDKDNNSNESINDILDSIAKKGNGATGAAEFVLGKEPSSLGLVFESTTEDDVTDEDVAEEKTNVNFEIEKKKKTSKMKINFYSCFIFISFE